jgi:hypothetical protein
MAGSPIPDVPATARTRQRPRSKLSFTGIKSSQVKGSLSKHRTGGNTHFDQPRGGLARNCKEHVFISQFRTELDIHYRDDLVLRIPSHDQSGEPLVDL